MGDFTLFNRACAWFADVVWQSGLFLLLGLAAGVALRRRPARAHRVLLLAMVGAIVAPLASQRRPQPGLGALGLGRLGRSTRDSADRRRAAIVASAVSVHHPVPRPDGLRPERRDGGADPRRRTAATATPTAATATVPSDPSSGRVHRSRSGACCWRLGPAERSLPGAAGRVMIAGRRVIAPGPAGRGRGSMAQAARIAAARLGLRRGPDAPRVSARRAARPSGAGAVGRSSSCRKSTAPASAVDWVGVFCHELAHWVRRDQWSGLLAELLVLPCPGIRWRGGPGIGWANSASWPATTGCCDRPGGRRTMPSRFWGWSRSEAGAGPVGGVEPSRPDRPRPAYPRRAADQPGRRPALGVRQRGGRGPGGLGARPGAEPAGGLEGSASPRTIRARGEPKLPPRRLEKPAAKRAIRGKVLGPDGKPRRRRTCPLDRLPQGPLPISALPKDQRARLEAAGRDPGRGHDRRRRAVPLAADFDPDRYYPRGRVRGEPGRHVPRHGPALLADQGRRRPRSRSGSPRGRRSAAGCSRPAACPRRACGSRSRVSTTGRREGMGVGSTPTDDEIPAYWPRPRTTDADGRFTLEGVPEGRMPSSTSGTRIMPSTRSPSTP